MSSTQATPEVLWAQRSSATDAEKNYILLTIGVPDVPKNALKLNLTSTGLTFTGTSDTKKTTYHLEIEFFAEIDVENSKTNHTAANVQMVLRKKDLKEEFWPRLLKDKAKVHYLRTDFDKWVDEDEQNEAPEDDYMNQFGGAGDDGGFGGIDFSKLGGAGGGMPGMEGMGGMGGLGAEGAEDDDEDEEDSDSEMPGLEGDDAEDDTKGKGKAPASASKVEELS